MKLDWKVVSQFNEQEPECLVAHAGKDLTIALERRVIGSKWYVSCEILSLYGYEIQADEVFLAMNKAVSVVLDRIHEIIADFRNLSYEISLVNVEDVPDSNTKLPWKKFCLRGDEGITPESGQRVLYEEYVGGTPYYDVGTYFREGDYLDDELPASESGNFLENMVKGIAIKSDRQAEESGFYRYEINTDTGLGQWTVVGKVQDVIAWADLAPSKLGREENENF